MRKNFFIIALLGLTALAGLLFACSDTHSFDDGNQSLASDSEMVKLAKRIVMESGNVSFPTNQRTDGNASRSVAAYDTDATLLWDMVKYYYNEDESVLIVPLIGNEEIRSKTLHSHGDNIIYQHAKTISKLIIRKRNSKTYAHIITYMPESEYAINNREKLDTIGYYPQYVDFHGITLISSLDGKISHGLRYENGILVGKLNVIDTDCETDSCTHNHSNKASSHDTHTHDVLNPIVTIYLYTPTNASRSASSGEESLICSICEKDIDRCECVVCEEEPIYCEQCFQLKGECICSSYPECPVCGNVICTCEALCIVCNQPESECVCDSDDDNDDNRGDNGGSSNPGNEDTPTDTTKTDTVPTDTVNKKPDIDIIASAIDTIPTLYIPQSGDVLVSGVPTSMTKQVGLSSVTTILEFVNNKVFKLAVTKSTYDTYYMNDYLANPNFRGVGANTTVEFVNKYFHVSTRYLSYRDMIDDGKVCMTDFPTETTLFNYNHNVLIIGYQIDGDLIYLDPLDGQAYVVYEPYFVGQLNYNIVFTGVKLELNSL